ncbi:MAG: aldehyde ferredoxin oxidoreductase C-terminal domain-containing protein [Nanoarchaeota archaeon]|nr:aldehyde ferredoxin oxidoreductase C-terminal domain-containing protein [Nanoarchaeota archaeon]
MIPKCYAGKLLYVNLNNKLTADIPLDEKFYEEFIGGKGIATKFLTDYVSPTTDPLDESNALIIMSGALNPFFPKFTVTSKSPLTNTICTSSCGGSFGSTLKKAGYDGLIIQGKAKSLTYLKIDGENVSFEDAEGLKLNLTSEVEKKLPAEYSKLIIGPAGENMVSYASITSDHRFAGRGGLGAVMGSKNLKAVIAKGDKEYDPGEEFKQLVNKLNKEWTNHARVQNLKKYGTANLVMPGALLGYTPVENYKKPSKEDAKSFENLSGEEFAKDLAGNASCKKCPIGCGKKIKLEDKIVKRPEYESIAFLGPNLKNYDKKSVTKLNELCDELGLDTISTGAVLGYIMETKLFPVRFNDNTNLEQAINKIAYKIGYGEELAQGVKKLSESYGKEKAMHIKGMEIAAYIPDGRTLAQTLGYMVNPRGACHLSAPTALDELTLFAPLEHYDIKGKPELVAFMEDLDNVMDSMGLCRFTAYAFIKKGVKMPHKIESTIFRNFPKMALGSSIDISAYHDLLTNASGKKFNKKKILKAGEKIAKMEIEFNKKAGHNLTEETLPEDLLKNLTKDGNVEKGKALLKEMLCKYFKLRE